MVKPNYFRVLTMIAAAALATCLLMLVVAVAPAEAARNGKIAFASDRDFDGAVTKHREEIYVMDADGSNQTRLTNDSARNALPSWQPLSSTAAPTSEKRTGSHRS